MVKEMTIEISTDQDRLDVAMIHSFLANESYWGPEYRAPVSKSASSIHCVSASIWMAGRSALHEW